MLPEALSHEERLHGFRGSDQEVRRIKRLFAALADIAPRADAAFVAGDYTGSLRALAALKTPVDAFFDQVMVNADDPDLKANRLALLNQLHQTMNRVADLSRLAA